MQCGWRKVDEALFAAVTPGRQRTRYHLLAERLPHADSWDWTVWRSGDAPKTTRHGDAPSCEVAMLAAEATLRQWDCRTIQRSSDGS
jgi:hypothetical protein